MDGCIDRQHQATCMLKLPEEVAAVCVVFSEHLLQLLDVTSDIVLIQLG